MTTTASETLNHLFGPRSRLVTRIHCICKRKGLGYHDAQDVVQETAIRMFELLRKKPAFDGTIATAIRIATCCLNDELRRRNKKCAPRISLSGIEANLEERANLPGLMPTRRQIEKRLANTKPPLRKILRLLLLERKTVDEVAAQLSLSTSSIRGRLWRLNRQTRDSPFSHALPATRKIIAPQDSRPSHV